MTALAIDPHPKQTAATYTDDETAEAKNAERIVIYTVVSLVAFAVGVSCAVGFLVYGFQSGNRALMIYSASGMIVFTTIGVAAYLLANPPRNDPTENSSDQIRLTAIANEQRGFLHIGRFRPAAGETSTLVRFHFTVTGLSYVQVESGEIRMSIDDPQTPLEARLRGDYTATIKPRRVDVREDAEVDVEFAAMTPEQLQIWGKQTMRLFFSGDVWYRDAFKGTPRHHKYFGYVVTVGPTGYGEGPNQAVRNDEEDER